MDRKIRLKDHHRILMISLLLTLTTLIVYWQVQDYGFINLDDPNFIIDNPHIKGGLNKKNVITAFFETENPDYWHPIPSLTHLLDYTLYGLNPKGYHLNNLLFHLSNVLLLFFTFRRMTGSLWRSAFLAAVLALHPLNVETVAWVSERKGLVGTFFWFLTIYTYVRYTEEPKITRYILVILSYTLGLMSKPILITLPFVLLLLDYWPLSRFRPKSSENCTDSPMTDHGGKPRECPSSLLLIYEKIPLIILMALSSYIIFFMRHGKDIYIHTVQRPPGIRIANAFVSYIAYIGKILWPENLAVFYPFPYALPLWKIMGASVLLLIITVLSFRFLISRPYFIVGWLWYLIALIPTLGLIQWGLWPAMADRFAYLPAIGLFLFIVWGYGDTLKTWRYGGLISLISGIVVITIFIACTWTQLHYWVDSIKLFRHTIEVTNGNSIAYMNLGTALADKSREREAIPYFVKSLKNHPRPDMTHYNLGKAYASLGKLNEAIFHYMTALKINPNSIEPLTNLGALHMRQNRTDEAHNLFSKALLIDPKNVKAHNNMGVIKFKQGKINAAIIHLKLALQIDPHYQNAKKNLNIALKRKASKGGNR